MTYYKHQGGELWTILPQAGGRPVPEMGQDGFLGYSRYFSNATQLVCIFPENSFPISSTHISGYYMNIYLAII